MDVDSHCAVRELFSKNGSALYGVQGWDKDVLNGSGQQGSPLRCCPEINKVDVDSVYILFFVIFQRTYPSLSLKLLKLC